MTKTPPSDLETVRDRVMWILANHPRARDDDRYLIILYWRYFDSFPFFVPNHVIEKLTMPETIRRERQYIQNTMGMFPPSKRVKRARVKKEEEMRRKYSPRQRDEWEDEFWPWED